MRWFTVWLKLEGGEGIRSSLGNHCCISLNTEDFFHCTVLFEHSRAHVKLISHPGCDLASWGFQHFLVVALHTYTYSLPWKHFCKSTCTQGVTTTNRYSEVPCSQTLFTECQIQPRAKWGKRGIFLSCSFGCGEHNTVKQGKLQHCTNIHN